MHEFVYLFILDVNVLYEVLFHIGGSFKYGLILFIFSGERKVLIFLYFFYLLCIFPILLFE